MIVPQVLLSPSWEPQIGAKVQHSLKYEYAHPICFCLHATPQIKFH